MIGLLTYTPPPLVSIYSKCKSTCVVIQDLEATCKILLLKSGETSGFIRDDNDKALSAMVCNVTPTRALVAITSNGCGYVT